MDSRCTKILKLLLRFLVTVPLLIWVFYQVDREQFVQAARTVRWFYVLVVWGLTVVYFWLNAFRLKLILRQQGCDVAVHAAFRASAITALYSMVLPGLLSSGVKWYVLQKGTGKGGNIFSGLVYNQVSSLLICLLFALAALMVTNPYAAAAGAQENSIFPIVCGALLVGGTLLYCLLLSPRVGGRLIGVGLFLVDWLPHWAAAKGRHILRQIGSFQTAPVRFHVQMAALTLFVNCGIGVLIFVLAGWAADVQTPIGVFVWLFGIVHVLASIPIAVANLGVREVTLVTALGIYGVPDSSALLMSLIFLSALVFMAAIGAVYQVSWFGSHVPSRRSPVEAEQN